MKIELPEDLKQWAVLSCPVKGLRIDPRMLELIDSNGDGHIRTDELIAAVDFLNAHDGEEARPLEAILADLAALDQAEPPPAEEVRLRAAAAALSAVEAQLDGYFLPAEDAPFILNEPVKTLPLDGNVNVRFIDAFEAFRDQCVKPEFGAEKASLDFREWQALKAKFAPYRGAPAPAADGSKRAQLIDEERLVRYRAALPEFVENFASMKRLNDGELTIFQLGELRLDAREFKLVFHVENEAAHSALSGKSNCCVIYLGLTQPAKGASATVCAVVTAGTVNGLYVGRHGVFYDRDGNNWEAVITKVVENQVSLREAFWMPWRKLGETVGSTVKKYLGDRQAKAVASVTSLATAPAPAPAAPQSGNGAALASSVAAVGIGIGMVGAAAGAVMSAVAGMQWWQVLVAVAVIVLAVSLPSVILTWFKLRKRDLGAILNAGGWAVNRPIRVSMRRAKKFTVKG